MRSQHRAHTNAPRSTRPLGRFFVMCAVLLLLGLTLGCEKDAQTLTNEGNVALIQKQYDNAITMFTQALVKDPKSFDATVGLAEVYTKKADFAKAKEYFDKARALSPSKPQTQYLDQKRQELLLAEAEQMKGKDPAAYEKILNEIIEIRDRGQTADQAFMLMSEFFMERGDALAKEKDTRVQAIAYYQKMEGIRTQRATRKDARKKTETLHRAIFADKFAATLDKLKINLIKDGLLDEPGGRIRVKFLKEDKEINPKTEEDTKGFRKTLQYQATLALIKTVYTFAEVPLPESLPAFKFDTAKVEQETIEKGKIEIIASVSLEELEATAYRSIITPARNAKAKAAKAQDKGAPKKAPAPKKETAPSKDTPAQPSDAKPETTPKGGAPGGDDAKKP